MLMSDTEFKLYKRLSYVHLKPWVAGDDLTGASISDEDIKNGSPKDGDMIARNPENFNDKWLVASDYFKKNFEIIEVADVIDEEKRLRNLVREAMDFIVWQLNDFGIKDSRLLPFVITDRSDELRGEIEEILFLFAESCKNGHERIYDLNEDDE
jgi:hypothetical protein